MDSSDKKEQKITNNPIIEISGLTRIFYDFWHRPIVKAVSNINLKIERNEIFGLLGPNGSGKSTTIKLILGLLKPTQGSLKVFGKHPADTDIKSKIGFLPEENTLYPYLTAEETLNYFASLFGLPKNERKKRSEELLEMVGLIHARKRIVGTFSKGMMRRIGLAQALINDPELIILDEPTSGLDPTGCHQIKDIIMALAKRGRTILMCSHLLADIESLCTKVAIMHNGKILIEGKLKDLLVYPEKCQITTPSLTKEQQEKIKTILTELVGSENIAIEAPTMKLEDFFIKTISSSSSSEQKFEPTGVSFSLKLAPFLAREEDERK